MNLPEVLEASRSQAAALVDARPQQDGVTSAVWTRKSANGFRA